MVRAPLEQPRMRNSYGYVSAAPSQSGLTHSQSLGDGISRGDSTCSSGLGDRTLKEMPTADYHSATVPSRIPSYGHASHGKVKHALSQYSEMAQVRESDEYREKLQNVSRKMLNASIM